MSDKPTRWNIYTTADPTVERIIPRLAVEIGLNESIMLLQIAFWINASSNVRDGKYWTYQSLREMREKAFPFWGIETIRRIIKSLSDSGYIIIGNYNKREGDTTQWFALEPDKLSSLKSVLTMPVEEIPVSKWDTLSQSDRGVSQNETTLPEIPTETTQRKEKISRKREPDPIFDAIAKVWKTSAGGYIGQMKAMMLGSAKKGEWAKCNFDIPATAEEILAFEIYAHTRMMEKNITEVPTACVTIQRWFYDMRQSKSKITPLETEEKPIFDITQWAVRESIYAKDTQS